MHSQLDPDVLAGFVQEVKGYLPLIQNGMDIFATDPQQTEALQEAYRHAHSIKGSASMMGLSSLSHLAYHLEEVLEQIVEGRQPLDPRLMELIQKTLQVIDAYANHCHDGGLKEVAQLEEMRQQFTNYPYQPWNIETPSTDQDEADGEDVIVAVTSQPVTEGGPLSSLVVPTPSDVPIPKTPQPEEDGSLTTLEAVFPADYDPRSNLQDGSSSPHAMLFPEKEEISTELIEIFSLEAEEHLQTIHQLLPILEQQPTNREHLQQIRRSVHTLKGSAAMVGFKRITQLAHRMEDVLDNLYEGNGELTPDILTLLFNTTDVLEDLSKGTSDDVKLLELYQRYSHVLEGIGVIRVPESEDSEQVIEPLPELVPDIIPAIDAETETAQGAQTGQYLRVPIARLDDLVKLVGELVINRSEFEQRLGIFVRQVEELQLSTNRLRRSATKLETQYEARSLASNRLTSFGTNHPGNGQRPFTTPGLATFQTYGFDDLEFDRYTDFHLLSRELSETTTDIHTIGSELGNLNGDFESYLNRQARLTSELQDKLMRVRMVPVAILASRLQRTVRNVAEQLQKSVRLILEGEQTEFDKTVLEEMAEPLLHLLRNAVDHGMELPTTRQVQGKPSQGTIRVKAFTEGTQVVLQIIDDGRGMDPQQIRTSAIQKGFLSAAEADALNSDQLLNLVFQPGFSTAKDVTEISGRGVGLDIVKAMVNRLKGTLNLDTKLGHGTTFTIRLPLTLAILRALLVKVNGQTFAIPLASVKQLLRLEPEAITQIGSEPVITINNKVYSRIHLGKALNLKSPMDESVTRPPVILLDVGERQIALVVDQLLGGREIVVKSLGNHLRKVQGIVGATLMGDGSVVLIVNPTDLLKSSSMVRNVVPVTTTPTANRPTVERDTLNVMVVDDSPSVRRIVTNLLKANGWKATPAKDGLEALELLNHGEELPDVIMLDIEMPRMDGYELLSTIRAQKMYAQIPVVMVTSRAGEKHRRKAMDLGANAYLVKPYPDETLLLTLRQLAGVHQEFVSK